MANGLGDLVHSALKKVGVTEERVSKFTGGKCNCSKRRETLNKLVPFKKKKNQKPDPFDP